MKVDLNVILVGGVAYLGRSERPNIITVLWERIDFGKSKPILAELALPAQALAKKAETLF
jgi:hypothetical protein